MSAEKGLYLSVSCSREELREMCKPACETLRAWGNTVLLCLLSLLKFVGQQYDSVVSLARGGGQLLHVRFELNHGVTAALVDSGATLSCVSSKFLKKLGLNPAKLAGEGLTVEYAAQSKGKCEYVLPRVRVMLGGPHGGYRSSVTLHVIEGLSEDIILGKDWLEREDPRIGWRDNTLTFKGAHTVVGLPEAQVQSVRSHGKLSYLVSRDTVYDMKKEIGAELFLMNVHPALPESEQLGGTLDRAVQSLIDKWRGVFARPSGVPPERSVKHQIPLHSGFHPTARSAYRMSALELQEIKKQLAELVDLGFVRPSTSSFSSPVLLVKKPDGSFRMCVDYRSVNAATHKNSYPLPRVDELFEQLTGAQYFSKLDLHSGYWQIEVDEADRHKTAFITRYGLYEWNVMPFGLSGAPATFQRAMNDLFRDLLDKGVVVYLDDVLIYAPDAPSHLHLLDTVLQRLHDNHYFAKLPKCEFMRQQVIFLGHVVSNDGIRPVHDKVEAVRKWPRPQNKQEVRSFLGLCSYYRRYIPRFASIASPLNDLTHLSATFDWRNEHEECFTDLKNRLCCAPILKLPDSSRPFVINTDASGVGIGAVLSQEHDGKLHPVEYYSRKLSPTERKYWGGDQEMLAVRDACAHWEHLLHGNHTIVFSDHHNLSNFLSTKKLTRKDVRWLDDLQALDIEIRHVQGGQNGAADALSRRPDYAALNTLQSSTPQTDWLTRVALTTQERIESDECFARLLSAEDHIYEDGLLQHQKGNRVRIVLPSNDLQQEALREYHKGCGHGGFTKTLSAITSHYTWRGIGRDVKHFVKHCPTCAVNKSSTQKPGGLLQPLEPPSAKMQCVSMDFITALPSSHGYNAILTITDLFTKYVFLVPCNMEDNAAQIARRTLAFPFGVFGLPLRIVSDRDPKFTSTFWRALFKALGTHLSFSTAYHPQTDGQSERTNQTVECTLRCLLADKGFSWHQHLHIAQQQINNSVSAATGYSPAMLMFGFVPRTPMHLATHPNLVEEPDASAMLEEMQMQAVAAKERLEACKDIMALQANKKRRPVQFKEGDMVYLHSKHIRMRGCRKLKPRFLGPFRVLEVMQSGNAVRLEMPEYYERLHDVFNVALLKPVPEEDAAYDNPLYEAELQAEEPE